MKLRFEFDSTKYFSKTSQSFRNSENRCPHMFPRESFFQADLFHSNAEMHALLNIFMVNTFWNICRGP